MSEPCPSIYRSPGRMFAGLHDMNAIPSRTSASEALLKSSHRTSLEQLPGEQADVSKAFTASCEYNCQSRSCSIVQEAALSEYPSAQSKCSMCLVLTKINTIDLLCRQHSLGETPQRRHRYRRLLEARGDAVWSAGCLPVGGRVPLSRFSWLDAARTSRCL